MSRNATLITESVIARVSVAVTESHAALSRPPNRRRSSSLAFWNRAGTFGYVLAKVTSSGFAILTSFSSLPSYDTSTLSRSRGIGTQGDAVSAVIRAHFHWSG